jgi:hypothetical protein
LLKEHRHRCSFFKTVRDQAFSRRDPVFSKSQREEMAHNGKVWKAVNQNSPRRWLIMEKLEKRSTKIVRVDDS